MLYHRLTIDSIMEMNPTQLSSALLEMQQELNGTIDLLTAEPEARHDDVLLDELTNLLSLRKVLRGRADELAQDEANTSATVVTMAGELAMRTWEANSYLLNA